MRLNIYICAFLLTLLHGASLCCGQGNTNAALPENSPTCTISSNGETAIGMTEGGRTAVVRISTVRIDRSSAAFPSSYPLAQELEHINEITIVKNIDILVDGQSVFVYPPALAELIEPYEASIAFENDEFMLTIRGGDGSISYFTRIYFNEKRVYRTRSYSSLCPDEPNAETNYWLIRPHPGRGQ